jgi:Protein of unknown function (DUF3579)
MPAERSDPAQSGASEVLILGITATGDTFRPSDWADRLCGVLSIFGEDQRISYSPYVKPMVSNGRRCVRVDTRLQILNPEAYAFLMSFARDNDLCLDTGAGQETAAGPLAEWHERSRRLAVDTAGER